MSKVQTDNSNFESKVKLRIDNLPPGRCVVLDCFAGRGLIWSAIKQRCKGKQIDVLAIEKKKGQGGIYLAGDNKKFFDSLDVDLFNVIDLDSYGIPYKQLRHLFSCVHRRPKIVFLTFIQSMFGQLPDGFLKELGFSITMSSKCPALFNRKGFEKLKMYLAKNGVSQIKYYQDMSRRKNYICFEIKPGPRPTITKGSKNERKKGV